MYSPQNRLNEYTKCTIFNINKKFTINYPKSAAMGFFSKRLKNEFEIAVVNKPSVFESLKFYCICIFHGCMVWIGKSFRRVTDQSQPRDAEQ